MKYKSSPIGLFKQVGMYLFSYFLIFLLHFCPFFFWPYPPLFQLLLFSGNNQILLNETAFSDHKGEELAFPPPHLLLLLLLVLFLSFLGKHH